MKDNGKWVGTGDDGETGKGKRRRSKTDDMHRRVTEIIMLQEKVQGEYDQMNEKRGIREHGEKSVAAILSEYSQLRDTDTVRAMNPNKLSHRQKRDALELLTLIKKKRCGKIKGCVCANGKKQRRYISREEVSTPTVQLGSILATLAVDAKE